MFKPLLNENLVFEKEIFFFYELIDNKLRLKPINFCQFGGNRSSSDYLSVNLFSLQLRRILSKLSQLFNQDGSVNTLQFVTSPKLETSVSLKLKWIGVLAILILH